MTVGTAFSSRQGQAAAAWNETRRMPPSLHASQILLYGPLLGNLLLALVAGGYAVARRALPAWFWTVTLIVLVLLAAQVGVGAVILAGGLRPPRGLHILYGGLVVVVGVIQFGLRPSGFLRRRYAEALATSEAKILGLVCLTQFALLLRAWMTGMGGTVP
ncbi:MAG: hypothetical protein HY355_01630 [Armatimonadetes bacterium]|nr:hypothetical protein [Armatimonadota bacterium]